MFTAKGRSQTTANRWRVGQELGGAARAQSSVRSDPAHHAHLDAEPSRRSWHPNSFREASDDTPSLFRATRKKLDYLESALGGYR